MVLLNSHAVAQAAPLPPGCAVQESLITCDGDLSGVIDLGVEKATAITVKGNLASGAKITGSAGKDVITVKGDVLQGATILGGDGDDTISVFDVGGLYCPDAGLGASSRKGGLVDAGAGDDTVTVGGGPEDPKCAERFPGTTFPAGNVGEKGKVLGGDGNDTLKVGSTGFVKSNQKEPSKSIEALGGTVDGGNGADQIDVGYVAFPNDVGEENGHMVSGVYGGNGNDILHIGTAKNVLDSIDGGPGDDTISADEVFQGSLSGGDGNDTFNLTGKPVSGLSRILGGAGNDRFTVTSLNDVAKLLGGPGNDTFDIGSMNGADQPYSPFVSAYVDGGDGNDTFTVGTMSFNGSLHGGAGDNTFTVKSLNNPAGVDPAWFTALTDEQKNTPLYAKAARIYSGDGADKIDVGTMGHDSAVFSGGGDDVVHADRLADQASIEGGEDGHKTIEVAGNVADSAAVYGGFGDNTIAIKGEVDTNAHVQGGNGADKITVHENYGRVRGDAAIPTAPLCTDVNQKFTPLLDKLKPILADLKSVIEKAPNQFDLDIPGDYRQLGAVVGGLDANDLETDAKDLLAGFENFLDTDLARLLSRPDKLGSPDDVATIKKAIKDAEPLRSPLSEIVKSLEEHGCAVPPQGTAGNDVITVDINNGTDIGGGKTQRGVVSGDGGDDTIKVATNTDGGAVYGDDPDDKTVVGVNTVTVADNAGEVTGGGKGSTCTIQAGTVKTCTGTR
ncbi:hypothetical protein [Amycolatopsis sp. H20-H5]|uniref:hypothetical protein n=1 Tax=Amycolatopsis sp. H20-H5 TaxID=3046309 RepID=UPI002DB81DC8|nr:hypothetical protein [Amycolatopsis sp. H20-H5]MEC3974503.1 hypothetical protein [Amycolatopsis sp. H20-H5]